MLPNLPATLPPNLSLKFLKTYLSTGELGRARELFDRIPNPDLRSLSILISSYTRLGQPKESIRLYWHLRKEKDLKPDRFVLLSVAKACASSLDLKKAKELHEEVIRFRFGFDLFLGNALVDMYGKCGCCDGARRVFDGLPERDVVSWTSLIAAHNNSKLPREGFRVFAEMLASGTKPNPVTLSTVLPICSELKALNPGREIHCFTVRNAFENNAFVSSGLVDMYAKCASVPQARIVFDSMPNKDVVSRNIILSACFSDGRIEEALGLFEQMKAEGAAISSASWNSVISGCAQNGRNEAALEMLAQMQDMGFKPGKVTITCVLPMCTNLEWLRGGREVHAYTYRNMFIDEMVIMTALVLMYAKCGELSKSREVFDRMPCKDTIAWNTMILAYSMHGCGQEALSLFHQMLESGLKPNSATFTGVLSGCSHSQLVNDGHLIFHSMGQDYGIAPDADHYACMVDVLGRAGHLEEAYELIQRMPMKPTASAWGALLGSCRVFKNVELGKIAADNLFEIEPENPGNYVLLASIYVGAKMWEDASKTRVLMRDRRVTKVPGCSWIQIKNKVYTFVKGDEKNAQRDEIYRFLEEIGEKMRREGYQPDIEFVLQDIDREEKEEVLCSHSEKLAVAFGIMNLKEEQRIRVFKNLRICGDCHNAIKFISKIQRVLITVRDIRRFHHFEDGTCSCRDNW